MRLLPIASLLLLLLACSQDGDVTVHNDSGPYLEVAMDGSAYLLDDGESVTKRIDIGRKFIFGPDDVGAISKLREQPFARKAIVKRIDIAHMPQEAELPFVKGQIPLCQHNQGDNGLIVSKPAGQSR